MCFKELIKLYEYLKQLLANRKNPSIIPLEINFSSLFYHKTAKLHLSFLVVHNHVRAVILSKR